MAGITERIYPELMRQGDSLHVQLLEFFTSRYEVASRWIQHYSGHDRNEILDIACGSGYGSAMLTSQGKVTGVDLDNNVVEYAAKTYEKKNVTFLQGSAEDYIFLEQLGRFDVIVSIATMEHLKDQKAYLTWIRNALRSDGCAILCIPSTVTRDWAGAYHTADLSRRGARSMLRESGLKIHEEFHQSCWIKMMDLISENKNNEDLATPSIGLCAKHYALHPHHLALRIFEVIYKQGFRMADQQYLLTPA